MSSFVQLITRHNLSNAFITSKTLIDLKLFTKQHVRHLPRWAHRRPLRVIYADDSSKDDVNYAEKLRIERECIQSGTKHQEDVFENADIIRRDEETVINTHTTKSVNTCLPKSAINVNYDAKCTMPELKLHSTWDKESDKTKVPKAESTQKSSLQLKSKKERKVEKKVERKAIKVMESAAGAGVPVYTKLQNNDPKLR
jgi:hypothetical protein